VKEHEEIPMRPHREAVLTTAATVLLASLLACASDRTESNAPVIAGPLQAEIIKSREPLPTQIIGVTRPIPTQITGTPTVELAGTPTVQLLQSPDQPKAWEYSIMEAGADLSAVVEQLNRLGKQGWEVVAEMPGGRATTVLLLKRRA
jgi:hypothetical protein